MNWVSSRCDSQSLCVGKQPLFKNKNNVLKQHLQGWSLWPHPLVNDKTWEEGPCSLLPFLYLSPLLTSLGAAGCGWREVCVSPYTPPPFFFYLFIFFAALHVALLCPLLHPPPSAVLAAHPSLPPGSHRPHKLIRHLLESSADSEAGRLMESIFCQGWWWLCKAEASSGRSWELNTVIARMEMMGSKTVSRLQSAYI